MQPTKSVTSYQTKSYSLTVYIMHKKIFSFAVCSIKLNEQQVNYAHPIGTCDNSTLRKQLKYVLGIYVHTQ